jgi:two-component system OmpR family response regulator
VIVEDEDSIAQGLKFNFEQEGFDAVVFRDGPAALEYLDQHSAETDLVVLDLMLPGMSGYEICRSIRERDGRLPVLVLSARTLSEDTAHAFDMGTDQYMTKPFALPELLSRVRNLLKRQRRMGIDRPRDQEEYRIGEVHVNCRTFELRRGADLQRLTTMEMQLLRYFIEHEGAVLSRTQILRDVWAQSAEITTRSIDNFVMRLRKYIEADPANPVHLLSVRGTGYRFVASPDAAISYSAGA